MANYNPCTFCFLEDGGSGGDGGDDEEEENLMAYPGVRNHSTIKACVYSKVN